MEKNGGRSQFEASLTSFRWRSWLLAMAAAVMLNCGLFLFLPLLMDPSRNPLDVDEFINNIQVIRLKQKETPPEKKKEKPPDPPKEKPKPKEKVKAPKPEVSKKLNLPFKLNTRLPSVSADFQLQYADSIGYGPLGDASVDMNQLDDP